MRKQSWIHVSLIMFVLGVFLTGCQKEVIEIDKNEDPVQIEEPLIIEPEMQDVIDEIEEEILIEDEVVKDKDEWVWYENEELGFRIKHPKTIFMDNIVFLDGTLEPCLLNPREREWQTEGIGVQVPLSFFVEDKTVYVAEEYFMIKNKDDNCEKMATTTDFIREHFPAWRITVAEVENEEELENFIDQKYGEDCFLSKLNPSTRENVYDVKMGSNSIKCHLNYIYVFKYSPTLKMAVAWSIGQDSNFANKEGGIDFKMRDTFEFIKQ